MRILIGIVLLLFSALFLYIILFDEFVGLSDLLFFGLAGLLSLISGIILISGRFLKFGYLSAAAVSGILILTGAAGFLPPRGPESMIGLLLFLIFTPLLIMSIYQLNILYKK